MDRNKYAASDFHSFDPREDGRDFILKSLVVPRPIAFITTVSKNGVVNAAPFSFFNIACDDPPLLSVAIERPRGKLKDTARNLFETKECVINICSPELAETISLASLPHPPETSEIELTQLLTLPSSTVSPPRIAHTAAQMECRFFHSIEVGSSPSDLFLLIVVKIHVHQDIVCPERGIDVKKLNPLARLSGNTYAKLHEYFKI